MMLTKQEQLAEGIRIAVTGHDGQFDKGGKPYILHPLHLMNQCLFDLQLATICVLHDWLEDCWITEEKLNRALFQDILDDGINHLRSLGFSERVLTGLRLLTHNPLDDYLTVYIPAICGNYDALRAKRKDLGHNSDITRLKGVKPKDLARIEKYHKAFLMLGEAKKNFAR